MDARSLAVLLKQTLEPSTRAEAEAELDKVSKIIGFAPGILQVQLTVNIVQWGHVNRIYVTRAASLRR